MSSVPVETDSTPGSTEPAPGAPKVAGRGAAWNASWNAFSTLWTIGISFVIAPLLIHTMGTDQYGILLLIWSVTGVLGLVGFGFGEATLRYIAHYFGEGSLGDVNRIMGATLTFYLLICAAVLTAMFAAAPSVASWFGMSMSAHDQLAWLLRLAGVIFVLRAVTQTYASVPMALQRYDINSKIGVVQSVVRSAGYIVLALAGFGIFHLVLWDAIVQVGVLAAQGAVIRSIAPGLTLMPSLSLRGLAEISGFSVFSFLTYAFHMMQRESAKMILGAQLGPSPVAYLGTPDNVAQRIHMVVASGSETLMPRFSANRDREVAKALFWNGTWASLVISLIFLLPLIVLLPDFLKLWISPAFARESALVGQLVAFSYISQGAYAPAATYFRGTGRPWRVTIVIFFAGIFTLGASLLLVPQYGVAGVGYAYVLGSVPAFFGMIDGWYYMFGRTSTARLMRLAALPILMGLVGFAISMAVRSRFGDVGWIALFAMGGAFTALTAGLIVGADAALGGPDAPSRQFLGKLESLQRRILVPLRLRAAR